MAKQINVINDLCDTAETSYLPSHFQKLYLHVPWKWTSCLQPPLFKTAFGWFSGWSLKRVLLYQEAKDDVTQKLTGRWGTYVPSDNGQVCVGNMWLKLSCCKNGFQFHAVVTTTNTSPKLCGNKNALVTSHHGNNVTVMECSVTKELLITNWCQYLMLNVTIVCFDAMFLLLLFFVFFCVFFFGGGAVVSTKCTHLGFIWERVL